MTGQVEAQVTLGEQGFAPTRYLWSYRLRLVLWEAGSSHRHARHMEKLVPSPSPERVLLLKLIHHTLKQIPGVGELESFSMD